MITQTATTPSPVQHLLCNCQIGRNLKTDTCSTCGKLYLQPAIVEIAGSEPHKTNLMRRYADALSEGQATNRTGEFTIFENMCDRSFAVIHVTPTKLALWLSIETAPAFSDIERLLLANSLTGEIDYATARQKAELTMYRTTAKPLHYGSLTVDGSGLPGYGCVRLEPKTECYVHRSVCFEGNSGHLEATGRLTDNILRSPWEKRKELCLAKLSSKISPGMPESEMATLLCQPGVTKAEDDFIEVHISGDLTRNSFSRLTFLRSQASQYDLLQYEATKLLLTSQSQLTVSEIP